MGISGGLSVFLLGLWLVGGVGGKQKLWRIRLICNSQGMFSLYWLK